MSTAGSRSADRADVRVLPPVIPAFVLAAGFALAALWPVSILQATAARLAGALLIAASIFLVVAAVLELRRARTAFDVRRSTTSLVRSGVYRFSRNPVYLAMMALTIGVGFVANSWAVLLTGLLAGSALCLLVIRPEERYLSSKFGSEYGDYAASVRRWI